jgi:transcriptional regulatory protein LEU3
MLDQDIKNEIIDTVWRLIDVLGSVALDGRHTPSLYSRFLSSLLEKYNVKPSRARSTRSSSALQSRPTENHGGYGTSGTTSSTNWPYVGGSGSDYSAGDLMDFSLNNFGMLYV